MKEIRMDYETYEKEINSISGKGHLNAVCSILDLMDKIDRTTDLNNTLDKWVALETEVKKHKQIWMRSVYGNA